MPRAVIVVGKAPIAGRTKTRLVPPLSATDAAALYGAFLLDTLTLAVSLGWERTTLVHPLGHGPLLDEVPAGVRLLEQKGEGLGDALTYAFEHHFDSGTQSVILIGSDNPTLSAEPLLSAASALQSGADVTIGPTRDGGYYLVGMRRPCPGLFEHIEWSTPRVFAQTLARAKHFGLHVHSVQEWYDVDEPADLEVLQSELATRPSSVAPHTRTVLARLSSRVTAQA
jgi:rSAM/selenodomain-associated transferase 1